MATITPYLSCRDASAAITFYEDALGAKVTLRMEDEGKVSHATLEIGDGEIYLADEYPEIEAISPATLGGSTVTLVLEVADADTSYTRALDAGAKSMREPSDAPYGRNAKVKDPFGHIWMFIAPQQS